jgi:hypothetical protein
MGKDQSRLAPGIGNAGFGQTARALFQAGTN